MTMKFIYSIVLSTCLFLVNFAQAPQGLNYQGVARNNAGVELPNQNIGIQLSILDGAATGTVVYTETHALLTDANGLFTLVIGFGTPTTGTFSAVNWAVGGSKWLKVSMDAAGGSNYQLMGTSQLLSVPYALFAGNVANNGGKQTLVLSDNVTDSQAAAIIAAEVGPNTQEIRIVETTNLTTVNLSMITTAISIVVTGNSALTTLNLGSLTRCDGQIDIASCPVLTSVNLSNLTKIINGGLLIANTGLNSINFNSLTKCMGNISIGNNGSLTSLNFPALTNILYPVNIEFNAITSNPFPLLISFNSSYLSVSFNKLSGSAVNSILAKLVSISPTLTGKSIYLNNQTPLAPPSGQGITDKATLIANGNTVTTD